MSMPPYTPPELNKSSFHCPHCQAYSKQHWGDAYALIRHNYCGIPYASFSRCDHCSEDAIWFSNGLIFPASSQAPPANTDLPDDIKLDYEEASQILNHSPRGAAALLRLCIQKLCKHLGESGKNINNDIAELVKKGLNPTIQKSLDVVRVIGNEAVHPGTIDLNDNPHIAIALFNLVNVIADAMITQPKVIESLYGQLPQEKNEQINNRDKG
jgi:hypothetical protein